MARGLLLAFEGIDGSGKSTQARRVADASGALFTFEPGDTPVGARLREMLLDVATPMNSATESLLMLADRAHHVASVIEPALASGRNVVTDRFLASTLAYQGYGRGVDLHVLELATDLAVRGCRPALTILLDVPVEVANARRAPADADRFESAGASFQHAVREGFLELARHGEGSWVVVDGTLELADVARVVDEALDAIGWSRGG